MALKDDPQVQALVEREVTKAVKAETRRCVNNAKKVLDDAVAEQDDKGFARVLREVKKELTGTDGVLKADAGTL